MLSPTRYLHQEAHLTSFQKRFLAWIVQWELFGINWEVLDLGWCLCGCISASEGCAYVKSRGSFAIGIQPPPNPTSPTNKTGRHAHTHTYQASPPSHRPRKTPHPNRRRPPPPLTAPPLGLARRIGATSYRWPSRQPLRLCSCWRCADVGGGKGRNSSTFLLHKGHQGEHRCLWLFW